MSALTPEAVREEILGVVESWLPGYTEGISPQQRVRVMKSGEEPVFRFEPTDWRDTGPRYFRARVVVEEVEAP